MSSTFKQHLVEAWLVERKTFTWKIQPETLNLVCVCVVLKGDGITSGLIITSSQHFAVSDDQLGAWQRRIFPCRSVRGSASPDALKMGSDQTRWSCLFCCLRDNSVVFHELLATAREKSQVARVLSFQLVRTGIGNVKKKSINDAE